MGMGVWESLITDAGNNKYTYTANRELCLVHHSHKYCNNHLRLCISSSGSRILNLTPLPITMMVMTMMMMMICCVQAEDNLICWSRV